jgi:hypothetical protein
MSDFKFKTPDLDAVHDILKLRLCIHFTTPPENAGHFKTDPFHFNLQLFQDFIHEQPNIRCHMTSTVYILSVQDAGYSVTE